MWLTQIMQTDRLFYNVSVKEQFRQRLERWRPRWYYWPKFAVAWIAMMMIFFLVILPGTGIQWVLEKCGFYFDISTATENWTPCRILAHWCMDTIDHWADRNKHKQFLLSLYEE